MAILNNANNNLSTFGITLGVGFHAWHPSIIDFLTEYGLSDWNGSRFVGAWTSGEQCPTYNAPENPYMQRSALGQTWTNRVQVGTTGVCSLGEQVSTGADTALFYNRFTGKLYVYWLYEVPGVSYTLVRKEVNADWTLGAQTTCTGLPTQGIMSPAFVPESETLVHAYYIGTTPISEPFGPTVPLQLWHSLSEDGGVTFGTPVICGEDVIQTAFGLAPWHLEAKINPLNTNVAEIVIAATTGFAVWEGMCLVHARSRLSDPTTLYTPLTEHLLDPKGLDQGEWDDAGLYRSSFVLDVVGDDLRMDLWYNGISNPGASEEAKVGYTSGLLGLPVMSSATRNGNEITLLTPWEGATIYYGWDEAPTTEYTGVLTIPEGASELRYAAVDGSYTEEIQVMNLFSSTLTDRLGNPLTHTDRNGNPLTRAPRGQ